MLTKRERIISFFTLGVITFGLILNFILLPIINKFQALSQEISSHQINLKKSLRLLARKERVQKDYNQVSSLAQLEAGEEEVVTLILAELESLSNEAGLRIIDVRPMASRDLDRYKEIVVELKQEGRIEAFLKFIYTLENPPHLLRIKRLQLNPRGREGVLESRILVSRIFLP